MRLALLLFVGIIATGVGVLTFQRIREVKAPASSAPGAARPVPVEVAPIEVGAIVSRRSFSGALEATAEFVVASNVRGRIKRVEVDLSDPVTRGAVLVVLDSDEPQQAVQQALAGLEVARANKTEAESALEVAQRSLERIEELHGRGVASESALDVARAGRLEAASGLTVAGAQITSAESTLEAARIRLEYTRVVADWTDGDGERVVAQRFVDAGETVSPNQALLTIVELDPITGVIHVPERDYALLQPGQPVSISTQAWPDGLFQGTIARIAPVFSTNTRQARVELMIPNGDQRLKPGMFLRATVRLEEALDATIVPETALTERFGETGLFVVAADGQTVAWQPVEVGIRDQGRAQVQGEGLTGRVVTLGQQLIEDGSSISILGGVARPGARSKTPEAEGAAKL